MEKPLVYYISTTQNLYHDKLLDLFNKIVHVYSIQISEIQNWSFLKHTENHTVYINYVKQITGIFSADQWLRPKCAIISLKKLK